MLETVNVVLFPSERTDSDATTGNVPEVDVFNGANERRLFETVVFVKVSKTNRGETKALRLMFMFSTLVWKRKMNSNDHSLLGEQRGDRCAQGRFSFITLEPLVAVESSTSSYGEGKDCLGVNSIIYMEIKQLKVNRFHLWANFGGVCIKSNWRLRFEK